MGWKFTVQVCGDHFGTGERSYSVFWGGQHLLPALFQLLKARRSRKYGCVTLECR